PHCPRSTPRVRPRPTTRQGRLHLAARQGRSRPAPTLRPDVRPYRPPLASHSHAPLSARKLLRSRHRTRADCSNRSPLRHPLRATRLPQPPRLLQRVARGTVRKISRGGAQGAERATNRGSSRGAMSGGRRPPEAGAENVVQRHDVLETGQLHVAAGAVGPSQRDDTTTRRDEDAKVTIPAACPLAPTAPRAPLPSRPPPSPTG